MYLFNTVYNMPKPAAIPRWLCLRKCPHPSILTLSDTFSDIFVKFHAISCNHLQKIPCYSIQVSKVSCKLLKWNFFCQDCHFSFIFHYWLFLLPLRFNCQSAVKFSTKKMVLSELQTCPAVFFHIHLLVIQLPLIPH